MRKALWASALVVLLLLGVSRPAQRADAANWSKILANHYLVYLDQTYGVAGGVPLKIDVWQNQDGKSPLPTVIYIHGGSWVFGDADCDSAKFASVAGIDRQGAAVTRLTGCAARR